jgi:hypothetical protein
LTAFFADLAEQVPDYEPGRFASCFPNSTARAPRPLPLFPMIDNPPASDAGGNPKRVQELSDAEQWAADLERLDTVEFKNACFFDAMGELAAGRCG